MTCSEDIRKTLLSENKAGRKTASCLQYRRIFDRNILKNAGSIRFSEYRKIKKKRMTANGHSDETINHLIR